MANVGSHIHLHLQLTSRHLYPSFIRALTGSIAMVVTGAHRWKPLKKEPKDRFWDCRPYSRVVQSYRALKTLSDYIRINQMEGLGADRVNARLWIAYRRDRRLTAPRTSGDS